MYKTEETQTLQPSGTVVYAKELTFDLFSRVDNETTSATAFDKTSSKSTRHNYSTNSDIENQIKDNTTTANLRQANRVDARGNILTDLPIKLALPSTALWH